MAKGESSESIAGGVGILLAVITLGVTAINGVPAFIALQGKEPYVAYEIGRAQMLYPEDTDRSAIQKLLRERQIPDAFATISLSNRGDIPAQEVVVSLSVPGHILAYQTEPRFGTKPAWVTVKKEFDPKQDPSRIRYILTDLGLARTYSIKVSFVSEPRGYERWEIFYDGIPGELVQSLSEVPENARTISFLPALKILAIGLLISGMAYVIIRYRETIWHWPIVRILFSFGVQSDSSKWRKYKNKLIFELVKSKLVKICSSANGDFDATDPLQFWDAIFEIDGKRYALEVHISSQHWSGITGDSDAQRAYCLRVHAMAQSTDPHLLHVVLVNDEEIWSSAPAANAVAMFKELGGDVSFAFVSGQPEEAALQVLELLAEGAA